MQTRQKGVIVAHPNVQHSLFLATALERNGVLQNYFTRFYYKRDTGLYKLMRILPPQLHINFEKKLARRCHKGLPSEKVRLIRPHEGLISIGLGRIRVSPEVRQRWLNYSREKFGVEVGKYAAQNARALVCFNLAAVEAFELAKKAGVICILDHANPDLQSGRKILSDEMYRVPQFIETVKHYYFVSDMKIDEELQYNSCAQQLADYILVGSKFSAQTLYEKGISPEKIRIIPYGVDLELFKPQTIRQSNEFRILFAGVISQLKGIFYLLEAIKELNLPNLKLTLCGPSIGSLECLDPYKSYFRYLGKLNEKDLANIYQQSDVFVFPSLWDGFGRVILEAMASGVPIITTPNTGGPEVIEEGVDGFIVPIRDIQALKKRIFELYQDREKCAQMGRNARMKAEQWGWSNYEEKIGIFFNQILNKT